MPLAYYHLSECIHLVCTCSGDGGTHLKAKAQQLSRLNTSSEDAHQPGGLAGFSQLRAGRKKVRQPIALLAPLVDPAAVGSSSFLAHPAHADAVLHLGAVDVAKTEPARVPVGLAALRCQHNSFYQGREWTVAGTSNQSPAEWHIRISTQIVKRVKASSSIQSGH